MPLPAPAIPLGSKPPIAPEARPGPSSLLSPPRQPRPRSPRAYSTPSAPAARTRSAPPPDRVRPCQCSGFCRRSGRDPGQDLTTMSIWTGFLYRSESTMAYEESYTYAREHLAELLDRAESEREPVLIRRRGHEDVALIAAGELATLRETAHLLRSPAN